MYFVLFHIFRYETLVFDLLFLLVKDLFTLHGNKIKKEVILIILTMSSKWFWKGRVVPFHRLINHGQYFTTKLCPFEMLFSVHKINEQYMSLY